MIGNSSLPAPQLPQPAKQAWILDCEGIGKVYRTYRKSSERISDLGRALAGLPRRRGDIHQALEAINLRVQTGESIAIIGPNGAGKSTLLRILAGIGRPTEGTIRRKGQVATLLELDSGFHPSLDARRNATLAGRMEGLHGQELQERTERVLEFADVGALEGQPFRTWSRGMQLRLGFAMAVTGSPDLLLVDEALAVGDERYRSRCIEHLDALRRNATALVFVTHDLSVVRHLADRVLLLEHGVVTAEGPPSEVVDQYLDVAHRGEGTAFDEEGSLSWGDRRVTISNIRCRSTANDTWAITGEFQASSIVAKPVFGVGISREDGTPIAAVNHLWNDDELRLGPFRAGTQGRFHCNLGPLSLSPGSYRISVHCYDHGGGRPLPLHHLERAAHIMVPGEFRDGSGPVNPKHRWTVSMGEEMREE